MPKRNIKTKNKKKNSEITPGMKKFLEKIENNKKPIKKKKSRFSSSHSYDDYPDMPDFDKNKTRQRLKKPFTKSKPLSKKNIFIRISVVVAIIGVLCMLQWNAELYNASGIVRDDNDSTSLYDILEVSTSATQKEIKKSYHTLSYKYHPDRNPNCGQRCEEITAKLNNAHEILSNKEKRQIYDSTQGSIASIFSNSIELTFNNFDDYVSQSRGLFIIQVYSELHAECVKFSPIWEEAIQRFEGYVQFGRVHATKQISVIKYLGTAVRDFPTVLSYVNGRYFRTYDTIRYPKVLFDFIHEDYPRKHLWIGTETNVHLLHKKWIQSQPLLPMIAVVSKKVMPSMLVSWVGRQYHGLIQFVHLYPKPLSSKSKKRAKVSTGRVRFISKALTEVFDIPIIKTLPQLITILPHRNAHLIEEKINKNSLLTFIHGFVQKLTPKLNAWLYSTVCTDHDIYCIIYLHGCNKDTAQLKKFFKMSKTVIGRINEELGEFYLPKWVQFAYANVRESVELLPLCFNRNDTQIIVTSEAATLITIARHSDYEEEDSFKYMSINDFDEDSMFIFVKEILEHENDSPSLDAPRIIPPVLPKLTFIDDFIEYLENIDWKDKDFQLNLVIIIGFIVFVVMFKYAGLKNTVLALFAMSIFGGALPYLFGAMDGDDDDVNRARRSRRRK